MESVAVLIGVAGLALLSLGAFALYRMRQRSRVRRVHDWVKRYLSDRYGALPTHLSINCSDDGLWPVLVTFKHPGTGTRRHLQFTCGGAPSTYVLTSEREETH